jgi:hypothetical protein
LKKCSISSTAGGEPGQLVDVLEPRLARRDADQLGVLAGLVAHVEHADRAALDDDAGIHRVLEQHECIERVAVAGERVGKEAVVGRVGGRREQPAVEVHPAVLVVDLVLVAAPARDLDDHVDAVVGWCLGHCCQHRSCERDTLGTMEFRRIENLPPYVFSIINQLKIEARREGADVVDLGFGNPDIPSPQIAVDKLPRRPTTRRTIATRSAVGCRSCARRSPATTRTSGTSTSTPNSRSPTRSARRRASAT